MSRDIHSHIEAAYAIANQSVTAGGAGDGAEVDGPGIDRLEQFSDRAQSADIVIPFTTTLDATETLTIAVQCQDSADGSTWADYGGTDGTQSAVVATGPGGGGTIEGCQRFRFPDFYLARQHVRVQHTPTLSRAVTDTCELAGALVVAGLDELPGAVLSDDA